MNDSVPNEPKMFTTFHNIGKSGFNFESEKNPRLDKETTKIPEENGFSDPQKPHLLQEKKAGKS
jgi:hypothetical protein